MSSDCVCGHPYRHHLIRMGGECLAVRECTCRSYEAADLPPTTGETE